MAASLLPLGACGGGGNEVAGSGRPKTASLEAPAPGSSITTELPQDVAIPSNATTSGPSSRIYGGAPAGLDTGQISWVVSLKSDAGRCSGFAVSPGWVITATHCGNSGMTVSFPRGPNISVDKHVEVPGADIQLLHLSSMHELPAYPRLNFGYVPSRTDRGSIFGFGRPDFTQRRATVLITDFVTPTGPSRIHVVGMTGSTQEGDSGGPLMVNGAVVGVASDAAVEEKKDAQSFYANLSLAKSQIERVTMDVPVLKDKRVTFRMGRDLFESSIHMVMWKNSKYVGDTFSGGSYYISYEDAGANSVVINAAAEPGAYIQVGSVLRMPGPPAPSPLEASYMFAQTLLNAVRDIAIDSDGFVTLRINRKMIGDRRVVIYLNDTYAGELYKRMAYYGSSTASGDDLDVVLRKFSARSGDVIEVVLLEGAPGGPLNGAFSSIAAKVL